MLVYSSLSGVVVSRLFDFHFCLTAPVTTSKNWTESGARKAHLSEMLFFLFVVKDTKFELFSSQAHARRDWCDSRITLQDIFQEAKIVEKETIEK